MRRSVIGHRGIVVLPVGRRSAAQGDSPNDQNPLFFPSAPVLWTSRRPPWVAKTPSTAKLLGFPRSMRARSTGCIGKRLLRTRSPVDACSHGTVEKPVVLRQMGFLPPTGVSERSRGLARSEKRVDYERPGEAPRAAGRRPTGNTTMPRCPITDRRMPEYYRRAL